MLVRLTFPLVLLLGACGPRDKDSSPSTESVRRAASAKPDPAATRGTAKDSRFSKMKSLDEYLTIEGDAYDKVSPLSSAIQERIEKHGLDAWDSPDSELDRVSTWEERAVVRLMSFYSLCSNNGRMYPHIDYGLSIIPELEAVGATETVTALRDLEVLRKTEPDLEESKERLRIEATVPGDFEWADPILAYVQKHKDRFLQHQTAPTKPQHD